MLSTFSSLRIGRVYITLPNDVVDGNIPSTHSICSVFFVLFIRERAGYQMVRFSS